MRRANLQAVTLFNRWPRVTRAILYLGLPVLFSLAGGVETVLKTGRPDWPVAIWREAVYCTAWIVLLPGIFWLCRWLHAGPRKALRYALGLIAGTGLTIVLLPLAYTTIRLGLWAVGWKAGWVEASPPEFWAEYRAVLPYMITAAVVIFASTVIAWYALTNYREAEARKLEAAELGAMLQTAQLQALRSQLNPHFLFNTLHSIAELIHENPRQAEQMLLQLGELLHKSLKTQAVQVTLREELEFIRSYLAIEQMRLGDRLEIIWKVDSAVVDAAVPSLILQPIVENAIRHGIAELPGGGRLEITAAVADGQLRLEVRDNGPGLGASGEKGGNGIGLENTRGRLVRFYGDRASFRLTSDRGVVVSMSLPWSRLDAPANRENL